MPGHRPTDGFFDELHHHLGWNTNTDRGKPDVQQRIPCGLPAVTPMRFIITCLRGLARSHVGMRAKVAGPRAGIVFSAPLCYNRCNHVVGGFRVVWVCKDEERYYLQIFPHPEWVGGIQLACYLSPMKKVNDV